MTYKITSLANTEKLDSEDLIAYLKYQYPDPAKVLIIANMVSTGSLAELATYFAQEVQLELESLRHDPELANTTSTTLDNLFLIQETLLLTPTPIIFIPLLCAGHWTFLKLQHDNDGKISAHYFDAKANDANDTHVIQLAATLTGKLPEAINFVNVTKPPLSLLFAAAQKLYPQALSTAVYNSSDANNETALLTQLLQAIEPEPTNNHNSDDCAYELALIDLKEQLLDAVVLQPSYNDTICGLLADLAVKTTATDLAALLDDACVEIANDHSRLAWVSKEYNKFYGHKFRNIETDFLELDNYITKAANLTASEKSYLLEAKYQLLIEPYTIIQDKTSCMQQLLIAKQQEHLAKITELVLNNGPLSYGPNRAQEYIRIHERKYAELARFVSDTAIDNRELGNIVMLNYLASHSFAANETQELLIKETTDKILNKFYAEFYQEQLNNNPNISEPEVRQQLYNEEPQHLATLINNFIASYNSLLSKAAKQLLIAAFHQQYDFLHRDSSKRLSRNYT